jgi:hypothetical protein
MRDDAVIEGVSQYCALYLEAVIRAVTRLHG